MQSDKPRPVQNHEQLRNELYLHREHLRLLNAQITQMEQTYLRLLQERRSLLEQPQVVGPLTFVPHDPGTK